MVKLPLLRRSQPFPRGEASHAGFHICHETVASLHHSPGCYVAGPTPVAPQPIDTESYPIARLGPVVPDALGVVAPSLAHPRIRTFPAAFPDQERRVGGWRGCLVVLIPLTGTGCAVPGAGPQRSSSVALRPCRAVCSSRPAIWGSIGVAASRRPRRFPSGVSGYQTIGWPAG